MHPSRLCWPALLILLGAASPASAQVGATSDIITGTVVGPDSQPIAEATVQVTSIELQVSRQRTTDARGRFTIVFPDGGGQYQVLVRAIGMNPFRATLVRQGDEDRLVVTVHMTSAATQLAEIRVRGRAPRPMIDRAGPGSTERVLNPEQMTHLPIDASDLNALATLAPGVVGFAETDTTGAAFSVAGQRTTANNITLDGLSLGSGSVPQDALRSTRIVTNTYDVARGQFSGGLVASTTKSGTNVPQGTFTYTLRDQDLAWGANTSSPFGQGYTQHQLGGGMGGPIVHDKLFIFGAVQGRWRIQPVTSLGSADPATLQRLGVSPDSASRFLSLVGANGLPMTVPALPSNRGTDNAVGLVRLDWKPTDAQTLTLRLDGRWSSQDPTRLSALSIPTSAGSRSQKGGGVMTSLTSYFGGNFINDARGYVSVDHKDAVGYLALPQGRVQVTSALTDSTHGVAYLGFGGNTSFPQTAHTRAMEFSDELSVLPGSGQHRIKLGIDVVGTHLDETRALNQFGTFTFSSLDALANGTPASFTRTLTPQERAGTAWNGTIYLGDAWRPSSRLQVAMGARLEHGWFAGAPAFNPTVDSLFGIRTDQIPSDLHLSPRVGFTWTPGGGSGGGFGAPPSTTIRGGIGDFRSLTPSSLYGSALAAPGNSNAQVQLVCVGPSVPTPDWSAYVSDPSAIPTQCADTVTTVAITAHPNATVFDPGFTAPHAWRGSLGIRRRLGRMYAVSLDASYSRGVSQYGFSDLNLSTSPRFTLADEGNRPVYVPAGLIVPSTGALSSVDSRIYPQFGQVLAINSNLASEAKQLTLAFNGVTRRGAVFQVSYTYTRATDQSSFANGSAGQGFVAPTSSGDPNLPEWATSDLERRHSFLGTFAYPITGALEVTAIGRLSSGTPFTPLVGSDINGDGARNDRAFVFDPATAADPALASAMRTLLAIAPTGVRDCLNDQLGRVAARNSCTGPWQPSLDFQVNWRPSWWGLDRRLTISLVTVNFLGGLDNWLHGAANLHGWGSVSAPDPVLLSVRGFDPVAETFRYGVNGRFGAVQSANGGILVPFQIGLQAHLALGPDRTRDRLRGLFGPGGARSGGGGMAGGGGFAAGAGGGGRPDNGGGAPDFASRVSRLLPNPVTTILGLRDSLQLSAQQVTTLAAIADTLDAQHRLVADSLEAMVQKAGDRPDPTVLFARLRPKLMEGREATRRALEAARAVLTPEQWAKLPDTVKFPGGGGRRRPAE